MKRILPALLASVLLLLLLSGCDGMQVKDIPEIRSHVENFLTATLENEPNDAYSAFYQALPRAQFKSVFPQLRDLLQDVEEYTLLPIHIHYSSRSDGKAVTQITYRMDTNCGAFVVIASASDNKDGLLNLQLVPEEQTTLVYTGTPGHMEEASAIQWITLILGFAVWGGCLVGFCRLLSPEDPDEAPMAFVDRPCSLGVPCDPIWRNDQFPV